MFKYPGRRGGGLLLLVTALLGSACAYPRVPWLGEMPSRVEIAAETLLGYSLPAGGSNDLLGSGEEIGPRELEVVLSHQAEWLLACRTGTGTFALAPGSDFIVPYFGNQAASALLPEYPQVARAHLEWYLQHLNRPDRWGLTGTVYDYRREGEREVPTGSYDSADAYAATFLSAVARYWRCTGDTAFVRSHRADLDLVATVITALQDRDGLVWARPGHWVKYLMDNSENFQGLRDYAWLLGQLGDSAAARYWAERAEAVRRGIREVMYHPGRGEYYWALKLSGTRRLPNWRQWYPDAVAQLFPLLCGVEQPASAPARSVYGRFSRFYPRWAAAPGTERSPWGVLAPVALLMGDTTDLRMGLRAVTRLSSRGGPAWHAGEAAYLLSTARAWLEALVPPLSPQQDGGLPAEKASREQ